MRKFSFLFSVVLLLQVGFSTVFAQSFMACDYQESLIEVVPENFVCGYTFSPTGYKPYGMFLQKDDEGYQMLLNYYKYDRDKVDSDMSSATIRLTEWQVQSQLDKIIKEVESKIEAGSQNGQWTGSVKDRKVVIKALMPGKAAIAFDDIMLGSWYEFYHEFKFDLGPEPYPNANRWEVTPYCNLAEYHSSGYAWIYTNGFSDPSWMIRSGDPVLGCVYVDHWGTQGCVVEEIDSKGKVVNSTTTDERGVFRLVIADPNNSIRISYNRYDPERKAYAVYNPYVKEIARNGQTGSLWHYVELNESTYSKRLKKK